MIILGINAFHGDSAAALVVDGVLVAAVEEERFNRIKHWAGFPVESVRACVRWADVNPEEIDHIALSFNPRANIGNKALFAIRNRPSFANVIDRLKRQGKSLAIKKQVSDALEIDPSGLRASIHHVEHHDAHIASGFFMSPFDSANILSVDGMGDFVSSVVATGNGAKYKKHYEVFYPHSLGYLYTAVTMYLGFLNYGDEYKVMGLAPYGKPKYIDVFRDMIQATENTFQLNMDYFLHSTNGISMTWRDGSPQVDAFHSRLLEDQLGPARNPDEAITQQHEDIAASLQVVTEEIILHLVNKLYEQSPNENLVIVGGCAMNSVANGKITTNSPYKNVYVPVGAADNGTAYGAAYHVWHRTLDNPRSFVLESASWGDDVSTESVRQAIKSAGLGLIEKNDDELYEYVVDAICDGKVVGWFQGRMEFGARALGNRSLLADPRRLDMRDIINLKIKFRERFRPFAPSILEEYVSDYFEINEPSPFMERVLPIKATRHDEIPAVTHVDGSGRLQTVSRETTPRYWGLIDCFRRRTGVPILLNTSLNENEPIVRTPAEAISCFQRTAMDMLVMGNLMVER